MKLFAPTVLALSLGATPLWAAPAAPPLPIVSWEGESALAAPVTLESPRLTNSELAAAVAAQTKVKLNLPPAIAAKTLVMRADAMPLRELLPALAQLYGLEWTRDAAPQSYSARVAATPLELEYLKLGDIGELRARARQSAQQGEAGAALALAQGWNAAQLKQGVAFAKLPAATGLALRKAKNTRSALNALDGWGAWSPLVLRSLRVRVVLPRASAPATAPGAPQLVLIDPNGRTLRNLGAMQLPQ